MVDVNVNFVLGNDEPLRADFELQPDVTYTADIKLSEATRDHTKLYNRDRENQHPMSAITGLEDALDGLSDDITAENNRAVEAEEVLDNKIDSEADTRADEITRVEGLISDEETRAEGVEGGLREDLIAEINRATNAEGVLQSNITAEENRAKGVEQQLTSSIDSNHQAISNHVSDKNNPHEVTKAQVGLGNVENLAPADMPMSTATKTYVDNADNGLQGQITTINTTIGGYGNIVTHNISEFATASQGALADTALQPSDNISELTNNLNYQTATQVANSIAVETNNRESADNNLQSQIDAIVSSSDVFDIVGTYAELQAYDISTVPVNDIIKVLEDSTHGGAATYYRCIETNNVKSWSYIGSEGASYTKAEADNKFVPQTRTVNNKALSSNITLTATDVGALPSSTSIPTATSDLVNDSGFITSADLPTNYVTTDTAQDIDSVKTFLGEKAIHFKQKAATNKLGFTLYNVSNAELGAFEYRPNTISGGALLNINVPYTSSDWVGFRYWGTAVNVIAPKVATAGNYYIPVNFTDGNTTVTASSNGTVNLSSILPSAPTYTAGTGIDITNDVISVTAPTLTNIATGSDSLTILGSPATFANTINIGEDTIAYGGTSVIIGGESRDFSTFAHACCVAIGFGANCQTYDSVAIGYESRTDDEADVAIGYSAVVEENATSSVALGYGACVGDQATTMSGGTALGSGAYAVGDESTAVGHFASATADNAVQIGSGTNSTADSLQVGNYQLLNTSTGLIPDARISSNIARVSDIPTTPDLDGVTIDTNSSDELEAIGTVNKNTASGATAVKYDWIGTLAEYNSQNVETLHPEWVCYITDDVSGGTSVYTKTEVDNAISTALTAMLDSAFPVGSRYITENSTCPLAALIPNSTWVLTSQGRVIQGADSNHLAGTTAEAGLPNIEGTATYVNTDGVDETVYPDSGAFYWGNYQSSVSLAQTQGTAKRDLKFSANRYNSIYGNSTTVQPPAEFVNI